MLEVATTEFLAQGYAGTSLERVAETAGFSKGAVYANFAGKEDLCLAVLETHFFAQLQSFVADFAAGGDTIEDRLAVLERWWEILLADDDWQLLAVEFAVQTRRNPKIQEQLAARERMVRSAVTALLVAADPAARRDPRSSPPSSWGSCSSPSSAASPSSASSTPRSPPA